MAKYDSRLKARERYQDTLSPFRND
jgi:hypothetical protein